MRSKVHPYHKPFAMALWSVSIPIYSCKIFTRNKLIHMFLQQKLMHSENILTNIGPHQLVLKTEISYMYKKEG